MTRLARTSGTGKRFGLDPAGGEVGDKSRLAYVHEAVAVFPWMTVRATLEYFASFRARWNHDTERALVDQLRLDSREKTSHLSKGQRKPLALIPAICAEPGQLLLAEPASGRAPNGTRSGRLSG